MNFAGKVILITGASSGIGAGTAEYFAKLNGILSLVGRNQENLLKTKDACLKINPTAKVLLIPSDVTKDAEKIVNETVAKFGQIDILVNNAGIVELGSMTTCELGQLDNVMDTNLRAVFQLTKLSIPHLEKTKGNIVNVSSIAGLKAFPGVLSYCLSKAALDQFTKCAALDLGGMGIRVNSVNPGVIVTDIVKRSTGMDEEAYQKYLEASRAKNPLQRVGSCNEVAAAIAFLASADAAFITGSCLVIDGGSSLAVAI